MKTHDVIVIAVLLWLLWPKDKVTGTGKFSYVGYDDHGNPIPLVEPPQPVVMPLPTTF